MKDIPLSEFVKGRSQQAVASLIGVNQSAVSQMLQSGRDIRIRKLGKTYMAYEVKLVGKPTSLDAQAS